jgi:hypothetical protein
MGDDTLQIWQGSPLQEVNNERIRRPIPDNPHRFLHTGFPLCYDSSAYDTQHLYPQMGNTALGQYT